jgi:hypothetical protein
MHRLPRVLLVLSLAVPVLATAYTGPRHVGREKRELRDDVRDSKRVEALLREYKRVSRARDGKGIRAVEARVSAAIAAELQETRTEIREQATEVHRDVAKVREDKREGMNTWDHKDPPTTSPDRRSLADDRRDLMKEVDYKEHVHVLADEWKTLRGDRHARAMRRKVELIEELLRLSRYEIRAAVQEVQEGQKELHDGR